MRYIACNNENNAFPALSCGPGHQIIRVAEMTCQARLVCRYVWRKTSGLFSFGYIEIFSSWLG